MSNLKATDLPTITRLFPPRPAGGQDEIKIQEQASLAKEAFAKYKKENCDEKGRQKNMNLTARQSEGKKSLRRRVLNKEIVIAATDKSGKYVITTPEIHRYAAEKHLEKDEMASWQEVKPTETLLNRHSIQLAASFRMGVSHNEVDRVNKALRSTDNSPPPIGFEIRNSKELIKFGAIEKL